MIQRLACLVVILAFQPLVATSQGASISLGGGAYDTTQPVEVSADELSITQEDGNAIFTGNVVIVQGTMRMAAQEVRILYSTAEGNTAGSIDVIQASGGVTLVTAAEEAEANEAEYSVEGGQIIMLGDVVLNQGRNTLAGDRLTVDLNAGTGRLQGNVRTTFQGGQN